jgi:hypothetical protein
MKRVVLLSFLFLSLCSHARGQIYQRLVNELTACTTYECLKEYIKKTKEFKAVSPVTKEFGLEAQRILYDFEVPYKIKNINKSKNYRLSLFVHKNSLYFAQLDQLDGKQLETSYLFKNEVPFLEEHVSAYNKLNGTAHTYKDLINSITSRDPTFWIWRN